MRRLTDAMILLMLLVIVLGVVWYRKEAVRQKQDLAAVQQGLAQFQEKLAFQGAMWQSEHEGAGNYPPQVLPQWFGGKEPKNPLVTADRPWMDIAPADDYNDQPPDPLTVSSEQASFWYNPNLGIVRARVSPQVSDRLSLELYNTVNGTALRAFAVDIDHVRTPLAYNPTPVTSGQHASPDKRTEGVIRTSDPDADGADSADEDLTDAEQEIPWWQKRSYKPPRVEQQEEPQVTEVPTDRPTLLSQ